MMTDIAKIKTALHICWADPARPQDLFERLGFAMGYHREHVAMFLVLDGEARPYPECEICLVQALNRLSNPPV